MYQTLTALPAGGGPIGGQTHVALQAKTPSLEPMPDWDPGNPLPG